MTWELDLFMEAMNGLWEVVSLSPEVAGDRTRIRVTYRSLTNPAVEWSHLPFHPELCPHVGDRGRIGFIGQPK